MQHIRDGVALVFHLQGFAVEPGALADIALDVHIRQEVHLNHVHALTTAGLTAATLHVETELTHLVTAGLGLHRGGEHLTDRIKSTGVGGWIGAGRASNRALVDHDHLVDRLQPPQFTQTLRKGHFETQSVLKSRVQELIHQGALAAATHPGDGHQPTQGKLNRNVLEVVAVAIDQLERARTALATFSRRWNRATATQVSAGERFTARHQIIETSLRHDVSPVDTGTRADVHHVIGSTNGVFIVFHHHQGVSKIPEPNQGV